MQNKIIKLSIKKIYCIPASPTYIKKLIFQHNSHIYFKDLFVKNKTAKLFKRIHSSNTERENRFRF